MSLYTQNFCLHLIIGKCLFSYKTEAFEIQYFMCDDSMLLSLMLPFGNLSDKNQWNSRRKYFYSATGGADSGPASLEGTPTDDKNGQQAFGAGKSCHNIIWIYYSAREESFSTPFTLFRRVEALHYIALYSGFHWDYLDEVYGYVLL